MRPSLSTVPEKSITVKEGDDVIFKCRLTKGHPKPRLFWRKKYGQLNLSKNGKKVIVSWIKHYLLFKILIHLMESLRSSQLLQIMLGFINVLPELNTLDLKKLLRT